LESENVKKTLSEKTTVLTYGKKRGRQSGQRKSKRQKNTTDDDTSLVLQETNVCNQTLDTKRQSKKVLKRAVVPVEDEPLIKSEPVDEHQLLVENTRTDHGMANASTDKESHDLVSRGEVVGA
jgi:hypothetical protein